MIYALVLIISGQPQVEGIDTHIVKTFPSYELCTQWASDAHGANKFFNRKTKGFDAVYKCFPIPE